MARKSTHTVSFLCGVSIVTLAGAGCFVMDAAQAAQANKRAAMAQSLNKRGLKAANSANQLSSRRISRFSSQKRVLNPKSFSKSNQRSMKARAGHLVIKPKGPSIGNPRLTLGGIDAKRMGQLSRGARKRGFGRIVNTSGASAEKPTPAAPPQTSLSLNFERIKRKKKGSLSSKETRPKFELKKATVTSYQVSGGADDKPTARRRAVLTKPDILILDEPTTPESKKHNRWTEPLAWSWGASQSSSALDIPQKFLVWEDRAGAIKGALGPAAGTFSAATLLTTNLRANLDRVGNPSGTSDSRSGGAYTFTQYRTLGLDRTGPDSAAGPRESGSSLPIVPNSGPLGISNVMLGTSQVTYTYIVSNNGDVDAAGKSGVIGRKLGMTRLFIGEGAAVPSNYRPQFYPEPKTVVSEGVNGVLVPLPTTSPRKAGDTHANE